MWKKLIKYVLFTCLVVPVLFGAFRGIDGHAAGEEVEIVLHKRILRDADLEQFDPHQNDGLEASQEADILSKTTSLDGAIFDVYDVTKLYQESKLEANDFLDQVNEMSCQFAIDYLQQHQYKPMLKGLKTASDTGDNGILRVNVPKYNQELQTYAVYLIVETGIDPATGITADLERARPFAVMLPVMDPMTGDELSTIHVYPKNLSYLRNPYFYKLGKKTDGSEVPLNGAVFVLYRYDEEGNKEYLHMDSTTDLKNKWVTSTDPVNDTNISRYTSNQDGLVEMKNHYLPSGTYYFEEIKGVEGYEISTEAKKIPVVIPESPRNENNELQHILVNGQAMEEDESGQITENARKKKEPRVYNPEKEKDKEKEILPKTSGGNNPANPIQQAASKVLPQTGEQLLNYLIILGCLFVAGSLWYWNKRRVE